MTDDKRVAIYVSVYVRETLKSIGNKGDTYNDIIDNLIYMYKSNNQ